MFTRSVRVGCSFPACRGELANVQTCLKFLQSLPTLVTYPNFFHLATGLSVTLPGLSVNETGLSVPSIRLVPIWTSRLYVMTNRLCGKCYSTVGNFSRPVCNCSRQACKVSRPVGNFYRLGPRAGKIYNRQVVN